MTAVRAEVKAMLFHGDGSVDGGKHYLPVDPEDFGVRVQVLIGEQGNDRSDSFDVLVCSPSWLARIAESEQWRYMRGGLRALPDAVVVGADKWLMLRWDEAEFRVAVEIVCDSASPGPDWGTVASRIGRLLPWEFDYRYDAHTDQNYGEPFPGNG